MGTCLLEVRRWLFTDDDVKDMKSEEKMAFTDDDIKDIYHEYSGKHEIILWCHGKGNLMKVRLQTKLS